MCLLCYSLYYVIIYVLIGRLNAHDRMNSPSVPYPLATTRPGAVTDTNALFMDLIMLFISLYVTRTY